MSKLDRDISVIIRTLANAERKDFLLRAIESVLGQTSVRGIPIVIANGNDMDAALIGDLEKRPDIKFAKIENANQVLAVKIGRSMVETDSFSILDDDDILLPHALSVRLEALEQDPSVDAVITNGFMGFRDQGREPFPDLNEAKTAPLRALFTQNWHVAGSGLYRSGSLSQAFFENTPDYLEWTYFGAVLAARYKIVFLDDLTFVYSCENDFSVSKSWAYILAQPSAIQLFLDLGLPPDIQRRLRKKIIAAHHTTAALMLEDRQLGPAWRAHLKSLASIAGWKYLTFTRHLIAGSWWKSR